MTTATLAPTPTLEAAIDAVDQLVSAANRPHFRGYNPHTPAWTQLSDTQLGKHALDALSREAGPTVAGDHGHLCYSSQPCYGVGTALGYVMPGAALVLWRCNRRDYVALEHLTLIYPGDAYEAMGGLS